MNSYSILNGSRMKQMSSAAITKLTNANSELEAVKTAFVNIGSNSEVQGEAAESMKEHMTDYRDVIDSIILSNEYDISDYNQLIATLDDEYYDGALIIQEENNALAEKGRDEAERDRCWREMCDCSVLEFVKADYYMFRYFHYCNEVEDDEKEYQKWLAKEKEFDRLDAATSGLFAKSGEARSHATQGLNDLTKALTGGNYKPNALSLNWRTRMAFLLKGIWENYEDGKNQPDVQKILDDMGRADDMSEMEFKAYLSELSNLGIVVPDNVDRSQLEQFVKQYLETKMSRNLTNSSGEVTGCKFDNLSFTEREIYVLLYEKDPNNSNDVKQMNCIRDAFEKDGYEGWEKDIVNIKFMVYTAEDPYKSIFIANADKVKIGDLHSDEWPHQSGGKIYINVEDEFSLNVASSYTTFFHEFSHGIDWSLGYITENYQDENGKYLVDVLADDVQTRIENEVDAWLATNTTLSDDEKKDLKAAVIDCIMNEVDVVTFGKPDFSKIVEGTSINPKDLEKCYDQTVTNIKNNMTDMASDVYGGFSGNTLSNGPYHPAIFASGGGYRLYWIDGKINKNKGTGLKVYTDDGEKYKLKDADINNETERKKSEFDENVIKSDGNVIYSGLPGKELWAEDFAANITGSPDDINGIRFFNPDTLDYIDGMYDDILN